LGYKEVNLGTNYYSVRRGVDYKSAVYFWDLRGTEDCIHIGKSSAGWCFSLHVVPELGINGFEDWIRMFIEPDRIIIDEYHEIVPFDRMMGIITQRGSANTRVWDDEFLRKNHAVRGPNGLYRRRLDHDRQFGCVGHGEGTYDYIFGEFS
jgi:hypothetical protein